MRYFLFFLNFAFFIIFIGCGSSQEPAKNKTIVDSLKTVTQKQVNYVEEKFDVVNRYIVPGSVISSDESDSTGVDDPVTGVFIKLKEGSKFTIVFHEFEDDSISHERTKENILAIEISELKVGMRFYPEKFLYYLLSYGEDKNRIDGKMIHGYVLFRNITHEHAIGNFDFMIEGIKKSFDNEDLNVEVVFRGNFKLPIVEISQIKK